MSLARQGAFETSFAVRIGDINYGGHMGNDRFLALFHDARLRFLATLGASERQVGEGAGLIMSEARIRFRAEAFYGDTLTVRVRVAQLRETRFTLGYEVLRSGDGAVVASGSTELVAFDYERRRVRRLPEELARRLGELTA